MESRNLEDGPYEQVSSVFINLILGLTFYTAAQIAEVVRGSIQSLPRGQSLTLQYQLVYIYQRLVLIILPRTEDKIPALTSNI